MAFTFHWSLVKEMKKKKKINKDKKKLESQNCLETDSLSTLAQQTRMFKLPRAGNTLLQLFSFKVWYKNAEMLLVFFFFVFFLSLVVLPLFAFLFVFQSCCLSLSVFRLSNCLSTFLSVSATYFFCLSATLSLKLNNEI